MKRIISHLLQSDLTAMLLRGLAGSAGLRIAGMAFSFVLGIQLARGLGAEGYGIYGIAMSVIAIIAVPTEFGLPQLLVREVAAAHTRHDWGAIRAVLRWSTHLNLGLTFAAASIVIGWLLLSHHGLDSPLGTTVLVGMLLVPLVGQGNIRGAALRGMQHVVLGQTPDALLRPMLFSLLLFIVTLSIGGLTPVVAMGMGVLAALLSTIAAAALLRRRLPKATQPTSGLKNPRSWISSALPMALTQGMHVLQGNATLILLGLLSTKIAAGNFRIASALFLLVATPISLVNIVAGPVLSRLFAQNRFEAIQYILACLSLGMTLCTMLLVLPLFTHGSLLIQWVYGPEFIGATIPTQILCGAALICGMLGAGVPLLNMCGHERRVTRAFGITLVFMLLTSGPLSYQWGAIGAAVSSAATTLLWNFIVFLDCKIILRLDASVWTVIRNPRIILQSHSH